LLEAHTGLQKGREGPDNMGLLGGELLAHQG